MSFEFLNVENLATMLFARGVTYPDVYCGTHTYICVHVCMYIFGLCVYLYEYIVYCVGRRACVEVQYWLVAGAAALLLGEIRVASVEERKRINLYFTLLLLLLMKHFGSTKACSCTRLANKLVTTQNGTRLKATV